MGGWTGRSKDEFVFRLAHLLTCVHLMLNGTDKWVHRRPHKGKRPSKMKFCLFKVTQFGPHTYWQLILFLRPGSWTSFIKVVRMISYFQIMWVCTLNIWLRHLFIGASIRTIPNCRTIQIALFFFQISLVEGWQINKANWRDFKIDHHLPIGDCFVLTWF